MNLHFQISQFGLTNEEINKVISIFAKYPAIEKAVIYGSRAKGNYKQYSDIDIVLIGTNLNLPTQQLIEADLDDLLLPYKFDLSVLDRIKNSDLLNHIARMGKVFYSQN
jgi:predicted nucleotidyltransferase